MLRARAVEGVERNRTAPLPLTASPHVWARVLAIVIFTALFANVRMQDILRTRLIYSYSPSSIIDGDSAQRLVVFRYDFDGGGLGDCIKGMVATMQLAFLAGCDFRVDFSRHPFGSGLPLAPGVAADRRIRELPDEDVRVFNMVDWSQSPGRRETRAALLSRFISGNISTNGAITVVQTNLAMSHELAAAASVDVGFVVSLAARLMASFYEHVVDGAALGTFWPAASTSTFRFAVHLRMGDKFIANLTSNKNDERIVDNAAMMEALVNVHIYAASLAPVHATMAAFACGDTPSARELLRTALAPHATVTLSSKEPVHIGYRVMLDAGSAEALHAARDTVREHQTLASADALFILTTSGFSQTACSTKAAGGRANANSPRCFVRGGSRNVEWVPFDVASANYYSPNREV